MKSSNWFNSLFILALFASFVTLQAKAQKISYGEACNATHRCDRRAFLSCQSETCSCLKPDEMIFEAATEKCVTKAGEQCKYILNTPEGQMGYELQPCVEDAECGPDGFCSCNEYFTETTNGTCIPSRKQRYDEPCNAKLLCSKELGLICTGMHCKCDTASSFHVTALAVHTQTEETWISRCVGKAGQDCIQGICVGGAICSYDNDNITGSCECQEGYSPSEGGTCAVGFGGKCGPYNACYTGLVCKENICSCRDSEKQVYSENEGKCIPLVGGPCDQQSPCIDYATCSSTDEHERYLCKCLPGYVHSPEGRCELTHGMSCNGSVKCDTVANLVCINGICQCGTLSQYDAAFRKCLKYVGSACSIVSSEEECDVPGRRRAWSHGSKETDCLEPDTNWKRECILGAYCKPINAKLQGICECKPGSSCE